MGAIREASNRVRSFFHKQQRDAELDAEISTHVELAFEENMRQGMPEAEARRRALVRFGGVQQAKELLEHALLGAAREAKELDGVLTHLRVHEDADLGIARGRLDHARGGAHKIAHATDIDDERVLVEMDTASGEASYHGRNLSMTGNHGDGGGHPGYMLPLPAPQFPRLH